MNCFENCHLTVILYRLTMVTDYRSIFEDDRKK